jgi:acyl carrier protein
MPDDRPENYDLLLSEKFSVDRATKSLRITSQILSVVDDGPANHARLSAGIWIAPRIPFGIRNCHSHVVSVEGRDMATNISDLSAEPDTRTDPVTGNRLETVNAKVLAICAKVLGADSLDEETDFFDLGADSIHVTQIAARLNDVWKVELSYMELFENATVARLSALVQARMERPST